MVHLSSNTLLYRTLLSPRRPLPLYRHTGGFTHTLTQQRAHVPTPLLRHGAFYHRGHGAIREDRKHSQRKEQESTGDKDQVLDERHEVYREYERPRHHQGQQHDQHNIYNYYQMIRDTAVQLDAMSRVRGYSILRITFLCICAVLVLGYVYMEEVKVFFSRHSADVTTRTLSSRDVQMSAEALSKSVVDQVLHDPKTLDSIAQFLYSLSQREDVQQLLIDLLVGKVLQDERTMREVSVWIQNILAQPRTQEALLGLVVRLSENEDFQEQVNTLGEGLVKSELVNNAAVELGKSAVHQVLDDEAVQQHALNFLVQTLQNPDLRQNASDALWSAVVGSVTPRWIPFLPISSRTQTVIQSNDETTIVDSGNISSSNISSTSVPYTEDSHTESME